MAISLLPKSKSKDNLAAKEEEDIFNKPSTSSGPPLESVGSKESREETAIDLSLADPATKMLYFAKRNEWSAVMEQLNMTVRPDFSLTDQVINQLLF